MEKVLADWIKITTGLQCPLSQRELGDLLYARIRDSPRLANISRKYREAAHETPFAGKHTHEWLLDAMQNLIDDHLQDENNKKRIEAHAQKLGKRVL